MVWSETSSLQVGSPVTQALSIPRVEHKKGMVFVHQQRVLYPGIQETASTDGWALKETRIHVFRPAQQAVTPAASGMSSSRQDALWRQAPISSQQNSNAKYPEERPLTICLFAIFSRFIPCSFFLFSSE